MSATQVPMLWWILAVVVSIITLIYIISMCAARKQIKTAIALVKEGSMVIKDRPQTMFYPFNILVIQVRDLPKSPNLPIPPPSTTFAHDVLPLQHPRHPDRRPGLLHPARPIPPGATSSPHSSMAFSSLLRPSQAFSSLRAHPPPSSTPCPPLLQTADITTEHFQGISAGMKASTTFLDSLTWLNDTINTNGVDGLESIDNSGFYVTVIMYLWILFGFLWTIESFNNISWTAMSGSVSHWCVLRKDAFRDTPSSLPRG